MSMSNSTASGFLRQIGLLSIVAVSVAGGCTAAPTATSEHLLDGGACSTTLEAVQDRALSPSPGPACPGRFDDIRDRGRCGSFTDFRSGECGGALVYSGGCGMDRFVCVYDVTSRQLVGAATSTDTNAFCTARSSCLMGGSLPAEIICETYGLITSACQLAPL